MKNGDNFGKRAVSCPFLIVMVIQMFYTVRIKRLIIIPAFSCKIFLRYFGKVRRKSNVCIVRFYWLIALYIFISLASNASFLIIKNSGVSE